MTMVFDTDYPDNNIGIFVVPSKGAPSRSNPVQVSSLFFEILLQLGGIGLSHSFIVCLRKPQINQIRKITSALETESDSKCLMYPM